MAVAFAHDSPLGRMQHRNTLMKPSKRTGDTTTPFEVNQRRHQTSHLFFFSPSLEAGAQS